ncbi:hypothetical protein CLHOM_09870 [Clostridium homopropionicum DSM 5847]|uniref:DUF2625 domain-containing protein n=1 Tax=Clostridium homopropionicum DSM 5847 TaxID=1121318 RepID=A0A0L6ZCY9_9CLOT|nr:DUF2625 domain-containing protein [Clostridium homopropionicum]KOA20844.1 hypothetical protein CLHOM_09870 [Clostridium homopropionicum DSM 5847]SFF87658.1 Protein of unknown function DUF2625 [Clostridium homopropionicum]
MKQLNELINNEKSAWKLVDKWLKEAINQVEILPSSSEDSERVLYDLQVTTKSTLGAIAYHCGGIIIQNGWIRILGCGSKKLKRDVSVWNKLNIENENPRLDGALLVADDVLGGFFAINGGLLGVTVGNVCYLAPDTLEWEDLELKFSDFVHWTFVGNINKFYDSFRWQGWQDEVRKISGDEGISIYPFLWAEGEEIEKRSRRAVPIEELWGLTIENRKKLGIG